jgi:hypothetical protein
MGNDNGDVTKICKYKIKKIPVMYSNAVLPKSNIICGVLNNITSNFGAVMEISLRKAINPIVTTDIKIP